MKLNIPCAPARAQGFVSFRLAERTRKAHQLREGTDLPKKTIAEKTDHSIEQTACKLLVNDIIDAAKYRITKADLDYKTTRLEAKITQLSQDLNSAEVKSLLDQASTTVSNLHHLYREGDVV